MADIDATPEVDATEKEVGQGYKDDAGLKFLTKAGVEITYLPNE